MINKILADGVKVGDIFPNDPTEAKKVYKDLIKQYHPDNCYDPRASDAIQAWQILYVTRILSTYLILIRKNIIIIIYKI